MKILYNHLRLAAVFYMAVPIVIFFIGWLEALWAVIFSVMLTAGIFFMIKKSSPSDGKKSHIYIPRKTVAIIAVISLLWCIWAGQGGFVHQTWDHLWRNAIFHDMIKKPWPVIYEEDSLLCYYICHWMIPAAMGKAVYLISGSVFAGYLSGNIALLIYSAFGCFLTLMLVIIVTQKKNHPRFITAAVIFILFSGLDTLGKFLIPYSDLGNNIEWWASNFQFSAVSTCLFWVYNQTVTAWLAIICIINERTTKNYALLGLLALPFAPFPFIGIVAICMIKALFIGKRDMGRKKTGRFLRNTLSPQNIFGCAALGIPFALYYTANNIVAVSAFYNGVKKNTGLRLHDDLTYAVARGNTDYVLTFFGRYLIFILVESVVFLILFAFEKKEKKTDTELFVCGAMLTVIPLFQIGTSYDFCMRVSIPFIIYIALQFISLFTARIPPKGTVKRLADIVLKTPWFTTAVIIFILGAVTPIKEFVRQFALTFTVGPQDYFVCESLEDFDEINNFAAYKYEESNFYRIMKKIKSDGL